MSGNTVNAPRYRVTLNGVLLDGVKQVSVGLPLCFKVGQFGFRKTFTSNDKFPASWWSATASKTMLINIAMSADGVNFQQIISGNVDSYRYDPVANELSVVGRDLAALMCDQRIVNTYRNQTASQIAGIFAAEHQLQANITATTTLAGRYYDTDHDEIHGGDFSSSSSEWDLLCHLGSQEGITPYVFGNTLFFNPPLDNPSSFPITFTRDASGELTSNVLGLQLERHMSLAHDVIVTVRSWHSRKKATYSTTVRTTTNRSNGDLDSAPSKFLVLVPNLTQAQCSIKARQLALDYSQHERTIEIMFPSFGIMTPQTVIQLSGTGTDFDMTYYPRSITYSMDFQGGARTNIQGKFSSPLNLYDEDTGEEIGQSPDL